MSPPISIPPPTSHRGARLVAAAAAWLAVALLAGCGSTGGAGAGGDASDSGASSDGTAGLCTPPNPAGCKQTGCPAGQACVTDPALGCFASSCSCKEASGTWICTRDCGGGACVPAPDAGFGSDLPPAGDAGAGDPGVDPGGPSDPGSPLDVGAPADLGPGPDLGAPADAGPPDAAEVSVPGCATTPNPAGCKQTGCPSGQLCLQSGTCTPSSCTCDPKAGTWSCKKDCGGGACRPLDTCPGNQVPTSEGCLSCSAAMEKVGALIATARDANSACTTGDDCTLTVGDTACQGACPVAVSKAGKKAFLDALKKASQDFCQGYPPVCGYATPGCVAGAALCESGSCTWTFPPP